jgi:hypothetical protein
MILSRASEAELYIVFEHVCNEVPFATLLRFACYLRTAVRKRTGTHHRGGSGSRRREQYHCYR